MPSVDRVRLVLGHDSFHEEAVKLGWGCGEEHQRIVKTMVKLGPGDILHFLYSRHSYSTKRIAGQEIRLRHPSIENNTEVLSWSLRNIIDERFRTLAEEKGERAISRRRYFPADLGFPAALEAFSITLRSGGKESGPSSATMGAMSLVDMASFAILSLSMRGSREGN